MVHLTNILSKYFLTTVCIALCVTHRPLLASDYVIACDFNEEKSFSLDRSDLSQEQFVLTEILFEADILIQEQELKDLFNLHAGDVVLLSDIERGIHFLKKKAKFKKAILTISPEENGKKIHVQLFGAWTFSKVKIKGLLMGNDSYLQYYILDPGDPFDINKHAHSLKNIRKAFVADGYFSCRVSDYLEYDEKNKVVVAHVYLDPGFKFTIEDVEVEFFHDEQYRYDVSKLKKKLEELFIKNLKKSVCTQALLNKETLNLKRYFIKKGFINAKINLREQVNFAQRKIKLIFDVTLHDKKSFVFFGNHFFSNTQLHEFILVFGSSAGVLPVSVLAEVIERAYKKVGFWHVSIQSQQEENRVFFIIHEGERCTINNVRIKGAEAFDDVWLEKTFFSSVEKQRYYDDQIVRDAIAKMVDHYRQQGFWDVAILQEDFILDEQNMYTLDISIDEGKRYYLKKINVEYFPELSFKGPFHNCAKYYGKPLDPIILQEQKAWLLQYFHNRGYLYATCNPHFEYDDEGVTVVWKMQNIDVQVRFGKTVVVGNTTFPFKYIQRELAYNQGDLWTPDALQETLLNLRRLEIFETIHVFPDNISGSAEEKTVIIKLREDDPFEVRLRVGFQQVSKYLSLRKGTTYKFGGSFLYKNPLNVGDQFKIDADVTRFYRNVSAKYSRPWLFWFPVYTVVKGYTNKYTQPVYIGKKDPLYEAVQEGALLGLERHYTHADIGFSFGFEYMETKMLSVDMARAICFAPTLIDRKIPNFFFEQSLLIDFLDDKLNPARGSLTAVSCKAMFPWKKDSVIFFKVLFEQSCFIPLFRRIVFGTRLRFGHIFNQNFKNIMPPERFYLGGPHSLRGYEPDLTPPLGSFIEKDDGHDGNPERIFVPQGGKSMINIMAELRIPVVGEFGLVVFQDAGTLIKNSFSEIKGRKFLAATGVGLRYNTPIGPLRFDIGFKWKVRNPNETRYAWFLTFGHAF